MSMLTPYAQASPLGRFPGLLVLLLLVVAALGIVTHVAAA